MLRWAQANPVRAVAVVAAISAALAPVVPVGVLAAVNGVIAAILGVGVHGAVTPVATAAVRVVDAARAAATRTAEQLTDTTVGAVGELTAEARGTINGVVTDVVGPIMRG